MRQYLRSFMNREAFGQFVRISLIGVVNTIVFFLFFNILRQMSVGLFASVAIAFALATLVSYWLNRRWAFKLVEGHVVFRETVIFFAVNIVAWAVTEAVVIGSDRLFGPLSRLGENVALFGATFVILIPKFASYRDLVFGKAIKAKKDREAAPH